MNTIRRIPFQTYWDRYGNKDFEDTDFAEALARLPTPGLAGPWVAGGSVRRLFARESQDSDFDYFFRDEHQFESWKTRMVALGAVLEVENDFNVTYTLPKVKAKPIGEDEFSKAGPELKVQGIKLAFYPDGIEAVLQSFDFSITQFGWDGEAFYVGEWSLWDLGNRRLVPGRLQFAASSLRRMIKYARQGFTICGGGLADMLQQVVDNPEIIQEKVEYID